MVIICVIIIAPFILYQCYYQYYYCDVYNYIDKPYCNNTYIPTLYYNILYYIIIYLIVINIFKINIGIVDLWDIILFLMYYFHIFTIAIDSWCIISVTNYHNQFDDFKFNRYSHYKMVISNSFNIWICCSF